MASIGHSVLKLVIWHYNDVTMSTIYIASQITSLTIVYSSVYSSADQRKHQSSASLAFVRGIHRGPVNSPHKWPVTRKNVSIWWRHHVPSVLISRSHNKISIQLLIAFELSKLYRLVEWPAGFWNYVQPETCVNRRFYQNDYIYIYIYIQYKSHTLIFSILHITPMVHTLIPDLISQMVSIRLYIWTA